MKKNYQLIVNISIILRLMVGPFIFFSVLWASALSLLFDAVDGEIYKRAGYTHGRYSIFDKALDYYWYVFVMLYILANNIPGESIFFILFLVRSLGQALFFFTQNGIHLFLFPNVFEIHFFFYLLTLYNSGWQRYLYWPEVIYPLVIITLMVWWREYLLHIKDVNLSRFWTGRTTYWVED